MSGLDEQLPQEDTGLENTEYGVTRRFAKRQKILALYYMTLGELCCKKLVTKGNHADIMRSEHRHHEGGKTMDILLGILIAVAAMFVTKLLNKKNAEPTKETPPPAIVTTPEPESRNDYKGHYQAKYLLTRNEWYEYKKLKDHAAAKGLQVCPKVRLLDIVEPRKGDPNYMSYLGRIKSKHVDFVICDQDLHIKAILELDDNSHNRTDRKERDELVDGILQDVGYTVIHTYSITEETLKKL